MKITQVPCVDKLEKTHESCWSVFFRTRPVQINVLYCVNTTVPPLQGCFAHKKPTPPRTLQYAMTRALWWSYRGGVFIMSEVSLYIPYHFPLPCVRVQGFVCRAQGLGFTDFNFRQQHSRSWRKDSRSSHCTRHRFAGLNRGTSPTRKGTPSGTLP